ncbi:1-aminocyclopropane-1-carboxylate oxidase-like [Hemibagrus wyckioides]|uniref:1-aminocyclopropane-1-carboxylate oxidase-like n=1 Tax=Hemibagrus wyckioides TaxID=337641 RepID=UPI00266D2E10|nr:1-aminocyclopropane-1-carboxylate oxidase-like [Hemibagrus wyckioides]
MKWKIVSLRKYGHFSTLSFAVAGNRGHEAVEFIPVVDFDVYKLGTSDVADKNLQELGKEIRKAFTEVGFVYLKNTGIDQKEVDRVMDISKKFFLLPEEQKRLFSRAIYANSANYGWVSSETER